LPPFGHPDSPIAHPFPIAEVSELPGVLAYGDTRDAAIARAEEELYVTRYEELMTALLERLRAACVQEKRDVRARIVDATCDFIAAQPDFLRLGSLMSGVLEQNLNDAATRSRSGSGSRRIGRVSCASC